MTSTSDQQQARVETSALFRAIHASITEVVRGKSDVLRLAVACFLSEGHLLIEDRPGTGKTSLARALALSIGGGWNRVQFTPDLLPSDITGVNIFNPRTSEFVFRPGPAFTNVLIGDEINRASPKTQSALLEVMEERRITTDGVTRDVPRPFIVIATQNPTDYEGTYSLPEVQLDRFAMRLTLGYTDIETEIEVLGSRAGHDPLEHVAQVASSEEFAAAVHRARSVVVRPELLRYVATLVEQTRQHPDLRLGVSTRGSLTLLAVARALAIGDRRSFVSPDDIKELVGPVLLHRMIVTPEAELDGITSANVLEEIIAKVPVPRMRDTGRPDERDGDE